MSRYNTTKKLVSAPHRLLNQNTFDKKVFLVLEAICIEECIWHRHQVRDRIRVDSTTTAPLCEDTPVVYSSGGNCAVKSMNNLNFTTMNTVLCSVRWNRHGREHKLIGHGAPSTQTFTKTISVKTCTVLTLGIYKCVLNSSATLTNDVTCISLCKRTSQYIATNFRAYTQFPVWKKRSATQLEYISPRPVTCSCVRALCGGLSTMLMWRTCDMPTPVNARHCN